MAADIKTWSFDWVKLKILPVTEESVDYVISNCVGINLSPEKQQVFNEAFRVLKAGGVFAVADITVDEEIPDSERKNMDSWSACVSGSISKENLSRRKCETHRVRRNFDRRPSKRKIFEIMRMLLSISSRQAAATSKLGSLLPSKVDHPFIDTRP